MRGATRAVALFITLMLVVATDVSGLLDGGPAAAATRPRIASTVLDPRAALAWDDTRWGEEFSSLAAAGIHDIVLQASAELVGGRIITYFPSNLPGAQQATRPDGSPVDLVHALLTRAAATGMTVWIGLLRDVRPTRFAPDGSIRGLLQEDVSDTIRVADAVAALLPAGSPVAGWYLPAEINTNYVVGPARAAASWYFGVLTQRLHATDGDLPVMTAPYFNPSAGVSVAQWQQFWTDLLQVAPLDVVALQDGTGDGSGRPRDLAEVRATLRHWFGALRRAVVASGGRTRLWAALDLYDFTGASAVIGDDAAHYAALVGTVSAFTSFSFTNQISPWTLGTAAYFAPFASWNLTGTMPANRPSRPSHARAVRQGREVVMRWSASSPGHGQALAYYRVLVLSSVPRATYVATVWTTGWSGVVPLQRGRPTCFVVTAYDTTGEESPGARACIDPPQAPARNRTTSSSAGR